MEGLSPSALEARLHPSTAAEKPTPDCAWIHRERRRVGVTLQLLHLEYAEQQPDGCRYSQFCEHYRRSLRRRGATMRQVHHAGEKTFVDYSGKKPGIWDATTGERIEASEFRELRAENQRLKRAAAHLILDKQLPSAVFSKTT